MKLFEHIQYIFDQLLHCLNYFTGILQLISNRTDSIDRGDIEMYTYACHKTEFFRKFYHTMDIRRRNTFIERAIPYK